MACAPGEIRQCEAISSTDCCEARVANELNSLLQAEMPVMYINLAILDRKLRATYLTWLAARHRWRAMAAEGEAA